MASPSKEKQLLQIILENSPLKHWHFEELIEQTTLTRATLSKWLKKYQKLGLLKRIKERGKFPYYAAGSDNHIYQSKKRLYMLDKLYGSGLIQYLLSLKNAKTVIIFGSAARGDWYKGSDIDIFIFGKQEKIEKYKYELALKRNIELHIFEDKEEIKAVETGLIQNISNGFIVKGLLQDFAEVNI